MPKGSFDFCNLYIGWPLFAHEHILLPMKNTKLACSNILVVTFVRLSFIELTKKEKKHGGREEGSKRTGRKRSLCSSREVSEMSV